jgi:small-conductance mechanosensitive channel
MVVAAICLVLSLAHWLLMRRSGLTTETRLPRQLVMLVLTIIALIWLILALPVSESTRSDLLGLLGLLLTGVIALSSTTFVANVMAGLMLRSVKSFRHGDFIRAGQHFGRVTERGLFHTEIQTEDRDLLTLPNLFLASNPITVIRSSGTIISCDLSLGYDVAHHQLEPLLKQAAVNAGLQDPFMQVLTLGDFSVSYRVSGYYPEVKHLISKRSSLRKEVLDQLHAAHIEIVSPSFMNQRQFASHEQFIATPKLQVPYEEQQPPPEEMIFDKADHAEKVQILKDEVKSLTDQIKDFEAQMNNTENAEKPELQKEIDRRSNRISSLKNLIQQAEEKPDD